MADAILSQDRLKELLRYDPETGVFYWSIAFRGTRKGKVAGSVHSDGYIDIKIDSKHYKAHRLAWLYTHGEFPPDKIDHIDGIRANNRLQNLRLADNALNMQNQRHGMSGASSKYLGVSWHRVARKWVSQIVIDGKNKYLGLFENEEQAYNAYLNAKKLMHPFGEIAKL